MQLRMFFTAQPTGSSLSRVISAVREALHAIVHIAPLPPLKLSRSTSCSGRELQPRLHDNNKGLYSVYISDRLSSNEKKQCADGTALVWVRPTKFSSSAVWSHKFVRNSHLSRSRDRLHFALLMALLLRELFWVDRYALCHIVGLVYAHEAVSQLEHVVSEAFFYTLSQDSVCRGGG